MPEIDVLYVYRSPDNIVSVGTAANTEVQWDTPAAEFGVNDLVELGEQYGISRWSEATDEDRKRHDKVSWIAEQVVLVGWSEAPITRGDVETHSEMGRERHPAVNIKVYDTDLPKGEAFAEVVSEHELDPRLAALPLDELRDLIEKYIENDVENHIFNSTCERGFEDAVEDAKLNCFPDYSIEVYSEGRQGGWLVVFGLPDIEHWDAKLLTAWHQFEQFCKGLVADIPRAMVWEVLANHQADLAGRVFRIEVSMVLSDEDLQEGDPLDWDWRDMLDLDLSSTLNVRKL